MEETQAKILLEGRKDLLITGVTDVGSFSEDQAEVETRLGHLQITGQNLHMDRLDLEKGEVRLTGTVESLWYPDDGPGKKKGVFGRIFSK